MNVLLINGSTEVRERIGFALESKFDFDIFDGLDYDEATEKLEEAEKVTVDLIIYDLDLGDPEQKLAEHLITVPSLLIQGTRSGGNAPAGLALAQEVSRSNLIDSLYDYIEGFYHKGIIHNVENDFEHVKIKTNLLIALSPLKTDIYIRLSEKKFIKLFQEGDEFDVDDLERYRDKKGVTHMYLKRDETKEFIGKFVEQLESLMKKPNLDSDEVSQSNEDVMETAQELIKKLGYTEEIDELVKTQVKITIQTLNTKLSLKEVLMKFASNRGNYLYDHSMILSQVSCAVAQTMGWGSETTFAKLAMAAFLHDIILQNPELAQIQSMEELNDRKDEFTEKEIRAFKFHGMYSAELLNKMRDVLPDVEHIVLQHHEKPDGSGFPKGMKANFIAPLAQVFIVAHELVLFMIEHKSSFELGAFRESVQDQYSGGNFRKIIRALK